jgi:hypothetical protein
VLPQLVLKTSKQPTLDTSTTTVRYLTRCLLSANVSRAAETDDDVPAYYPPGHCLFTPQALPPMPPVLHLKSFNEQHARTQAGLWKLRRGSLSPQAEPLHEPALFCPWVEKTMFQTHALPDSIPQLPIPRKATLNLPNFEHNLSRKQTFVLN